MNVEKPMIETKSCITSITRLHTLVAMAFLRRLSNPMNSVLNHRALRNASLAMWLEESESRLSAERAF